MWSRSFDGRGRSSIAGTGGEPLQVADERGPFGPAEALDDRRLRSYPDGIGGLQNLEPFASEFGGP